MTKEDYIRMLNDHDWLYFTSEDPERYEMGRFNHNKLLRRANTPELVKLFNQYKDAAHNSIRANQVK